MKGNRCKTIILEGVDAVGKSSQTKLLCDYLESTNKKIAFVKSPWNDGFTFKLIYWMLKNGLARKLQNVFQLIHFVNKLVFQTFVLPKLLEENDFIVFDRWSISMWAYGIPDGASSKLTLWMLSKIKEPDLTIILDGEQFARKVNDSYESDFRYQNHVRAMYMFWAMATDSSHICIVEANQTVENVKNDIVSALKRKGILDENV